MAEQYWIGGFYIDLSRNQITQNNESKKLAPKALSLLTYLAQHQGKVVSQEELLSQVWQGSVVSPNTLQRSIAQLRKALGDDGKVQVYIKTHAKKGYSLECDVRWNQEVIKTENQLDTAPIENIKRDVESEIADNNTSRSETLSANMPSAPSPRLRSRFVLWGLATVILLCTFLAFQFSGTAQSPSLKIGEIRALTATDNKELAGIYSPDGKYIVFHRYSNEFCSNNIWAKDIETQQEFQLTQNLNSYGAHSFSKDGKSLVFVQSETCTAPVMQKKCYYLMSLDFEQALKSPQMPKVLLECKSSEIRKPQWLNNNNIVLLQKSSERWKLINYSIADNQSETVYQLEDGNLVDYDYSMKHDVFALFSTQNEGYFINMLKPTGELISSHQIIYPPEIAPFKFVYPNFSPFENLLLFSTGRQLFSLSYDGQVNQISLPIEEPMGSPVFHPDSKRMLAIKGQYDSDVVSIPLDLIEKGRVLNDSYTAISRSTSGEDNALFQPNGDVIAFQSKRSGVDQIWLTQKSNPQQLSHFPTDTYLYEMHWASNGKSLLVNVDKTLTQVFLDGTQITYNFEHQVDTLFDWDSKKKTALSLVRVNGVLKFAQLHLADLTTHILNDKQVNWAQKSTDGAIIFTDQMDRFWQSGPVEDLMIDVLRDQGSDKRFILHRETANDDNMARDMLYGINEDFQLWSYSVNDGEFNVIGNAPKNIDYLTDMQGTEVLMTLRKVARKEVVELLLSD